MASTREKRRKALALALTSGASTGVARNPAVASGAAGRLSRGAGVNFPRFARSLDPVTGLPVRGSPTTFTRPVFVPRRRG